MVRIRFISARPSSPLESRSASIRNLDPEAGFVGEITDPTADGDSCAVALPCVAWTTDSGASADVAVTLDSLPAWV